MASAYPVHLVLVGPPGAGKGTQAVMLERELGLKQISSGDLFRENLKNQTELGQLAQAYMDRGELVPDNVTIAMVAERIQRSDCAKGVIFDGFPRTLEQAKALDEMLALQDSEIRLVPALVSSDEVVIDRMTGRRVCRNCGAVYQISYNPPKVEGVCDVCSGELYQRSDDSPETVRNRLYVYYKQTSPLIGYYFAKNLLVRVNADQPIDAVNQAMLEAVKVVIA